MQLSLWASVKTRWRGLGFAGKEVEELEKEDVLTNIVVMKLDMLRCVCGSYALDLCGAG